MGTYGHAAACGALIFWSGQIRSGDYALSAGRVQIGTHIIIHGIFGFPAHGTGPDRYSWGH